MFDAIAPRYDLLNRLMSLGRDRSWRRLVVDELLTAPGKSWVLDLATGTAELALEIVQQRPDLSVCGLDPSRSMLLLGRRKIAAAGAHRRIRLLSGDAQSLPFATASFGAAAIAFGIRNVPDRDRALREMTRVVAPGGRVIVLELGEPQQTPLAPLARFHIRRIVPRLGALLSGSAQYHYLERSIAAFPSPTAFADMMRAAGQRVVAVRPLTLGACTLYVGQVMDEDPASPQETR
jgi:demethylmenaquinone methyltransferase/2-methoxy-6-polyprenyl-1,4-benzoquinol methylase